MRWRFGTLPRGRQLRRDAAEAPAFQINRALKNDRLIVPNMTVVKKAPVETVRQTPDKSRPPVPREPEDAAKTKILDGCEPAFSSVTMPTLAHIASRCIG